MTEKQCHNFPCMRVGTNIVRRGKMNVRMCDKWLQVRKAALKVKK